MSTAQTSFCSQDLLAEPAKAAYVSDVAPKAMTYLHALEKAMK
jgi:hypothetical protein